MDPRNMGWGSLHSDLEEGQSSIAGYQRAENRAWSTGQQAPITYKVVGVMVTKILMGSSLSSYLKMCPRKSKAGACGRKLKSLSICPDSGFVQGCHTAECLGSNLKQLFSHRRCQLLSKGFVPVCECSYFVMSSLALIFIY